MTKEEISKVIKVDISRLCMSFAEAQRRNPKMEAKAKAYNKNRSIDWTLEEALEGIKYIYCYTPMMARYLKENFIHRDSNYLYKQRNKLSDDAKSFIFMWESHDKKYYACCSCIYFTAKTMNRAGCKPSPFCTFYDCFLNKVKPKRNIYKDRCPTFRMTKGEPLIFTPAGPMPLNKIGTGSTDMMGIPQSEFKSKRESDEPLIILQDAFTHSRT